MKRSLVFAAFIVLLAFLPPLAVAAAATNPPCSTEKVNHQSCTIRFDRRYPVTMPTIQMSHGRQVIVEVKNPLDFETLSLDETGATALPGTDQLAGFVTSALPDLKGLVWSNVTSPTPAGPNKTHAIPAQPTREEIAQEKLVDAELDVLQSLLDTAQGEVQKTLGDTGLYANIRAVYEQLNQAMAPIPKPGSGSQGPYAAPPDAAQTPNPWMAYGDWRGVVLCELAGGKGCEDRTPTVPAFTNVLGAIGALQGRLPATPPAPAPSDPIFNQTAFDALAKQAKADIAKVTDPKAAADDAGRLKSIQDQENSLTSQLAALGNTLTNVQKDFLTYYQNVLLATHAVPAPMMEDGEPTATIGTIYDPQSNQANVPIHYAKFLGRQVVFSVNAVNNLTTAMTSITTATARVSIATVTVLYADPRLEASAGAMVSFVHNRSFVNQTLADGDIAIAQTKTDPEVVPMVALHYRVGDDFDWIGHRRAAWYGTGWVGLNPYSTVPEYGAGPTFAWRSIMLSFLYNRAHQTVLIAGETVGPPICSPTATATLPACTPAPPAPVTKTVGLNAFAIGLTVRIPTSFVAGPGGVSR